MPKRIRIKFHYTLAYYLLEETVSANIHPYDAAIQIVRQVNYFIYGYPHFKLSSHLFCFSVIFRMCVHMIENRKGKNERIKKGIQGNDKIREGTRRHTCTVITVEVAKIGKTRSYIFHAEDNAHTVENQAKNLATFTCVTARAVNNSQKLVFQIGRNSIYL